MQCVFDWYERESGICFFWNNTGCNTCRCSIWWERQSDAGFGEKERNKYRDRNNSNDQFRHDSAILSGAWISDWNRDTSSDLYGIWILYVYTGNAGVFSKDNRWFWRRKSTEFGWWWYEQFCGLWRRYHYHSVWYRKKYCGVGRWFHKYICDQKCRYRHDIFGRRRYFFLWICRWSVYYNESCIDWCKWNNGYDYRWWHWNGGCIFLCQNWCIRWSCKRNDRSVCLWRWCHIWGAFWGDRGQWV